MASLKYFLGLDLGQSVDYTAIALVERAEQTGAWDAVQFAHRKTATLRLRYLERVPLRTPYPEVVERVERMTRMPEMAGQCTLIVDATGVGQAVVDLLERSRVGCPMKRVKITSGDVERYADGCYRVPKRDLVARVQVAMQQGGMEIARAIPQGEALLREMAEMRVKVLPSGYEQFGAAREGEHDDLVLAVSLACWGAAKAYPRELIGESGYWQREGVEFHGKGRIV